MRVEVGRGLEKRKCSRLTGSQLNLEPGLTPVCGATNREAGGPLGTNQDG